MGVKRPDPRKMRPKKLLRDLKRVAADYGFTFDGFSGGMHYVWRNGDKIVTTASTPSNNDEEVKSFRRKCERAV